MSENGQATSRVMADVESQRIARVYAEALLNAAQAQGKSDTVIQELDSIVNDLFPADAQLELFFSSSFVGRERKAPVIQKVFGGRASDLLTNFLLVLNQHERLNLLRPILAAIRDLHDERNHRMRVLVRTAVALPEDQRERLRAELRRSFQREPVLEAKVDPDILGGMVVRVGDWLYDASVRTQLETIRNQLIERSSYEIQSRRDRFRSANGD